jgi:exosortase
MSAIAPPEQFAESGARPALWLITGVLFAAFIAGPATSLMQDWWSDPDASHGLLLAPVAFWLAWRARLRGDVRPAPWLGIALLVAAVLGRYAADLAAEIYIGRMSVLLAMAGFTLFYRGVGQLRAWWLPFTLLVLSVPPPAVIIAQITLPLQLEASRLGAALLDMRSVPVQLAGNVIRLPNQDLFVAEACSGLRSLTALVSIGVLAAGVWLSHPVSRLLLIAVAVPIAVAVNAIRVFITGYAIYFIGPEAGQGVLHFTEGWLLFVVSLGALFALGAGGRIVERWVSRRSRRQVEATE